MLTIESSTVEIEITAKLRTIKPSKMRSRYAPADLDGAIISAAKAAKRYGVPYYVTAGNSYGHFCYRVSYKKSDALCPIGNTGKRMFEVAPDMTLTRHTVARPF